MLNVNDIVVFSLTSSVEVTKAVCEDLGIEPGLVKVSHFADGEILCKAAQTVRAKKCYVIQSTCAPVTERLFEVLVFCDSLKRASAAEINVILPYYGYARQDRKASSREPITSKLVADLLQCAGAHRVVVFDLHAPQIQGYFDCPVDNLSCVNMIGQYFKKKLANEDLCVVSPDHGGVVRARNLASILDCPIAIFDKRRPKPNVAEICDIIGECKDKVCILIDDMIDTGGTIVAAANELMKRGARKVFVGCSHPVLSNDAMDKLENSCIEEVVTTDTIPLKRESKKFTVLSIAHMISKTIKCIENGESIAPLYDEKA